jgi:hypothetical protein
MGTALSLISSFAIRNSTQVCLVLLIAIITALTAYIETTHYTTRKVALP